MNPTTPAAAYQPLAVEPGNPLPSRLTEGASVLWINPRTGKADTEPGVVKQILPDPNEAYPIVVRWADGMLGRYARAELQVVIA